MALHLFLQFLMCKWRFLFFKAVLGRAFSSTFYCDENIYIVVTSPMWLVNAWDLSSVKNWILVSVQLNLKIYVTYGLQVYAPPKFIWWNPNPQRWCY